MLMRFASLILLSFLISACSLFGSKPQVVDNQAAGEAPLTDEVVEAFGAALELLNDEKFVEAETLLTDLTAKNPNLPGVWVNLAIAQQNQKKYADAVISTDKAIAINKDYCAAFKVKGINLREQGKFEETKLAYIEALRCDEDDADSMYNLGVLYDLYLHKKDHALYCYSEYQKSFVKANNEEEKTVAIWIKTIARKFQSTEPMEIAELNKARLAEKQRIAAEQKALNANSAAAQGEQVAENLEQAADAENGQDQRQEKVEETQEKIEQQTAGKAAQEAGAATKENTEAATEQTVAEQQQAAPDASAPAETVPNQQKAIEQGVANE